MPFKITGKIILFIFLAGFAIFASTDIRTDNSYISGKTKIQVSRELNISLRTVYFHTTDIIVGQIHDFPICAKTFDLLQDIMKNGYALKSKKYTFQNYQKLRLKFPNIRRVKVHGRVIYFIEDKADLACKIFLQNLPKKITNYHELKQVVDVFKTQMKKEEKMLYIQKRK